MYSLIFSSSGKALLESSPDISYYSIGLFPLLQHAQQTLKPALLSLYADHYISLDLRVLRPLLLGLVLALLPGLDEEGNEYYDRVIGLLDALSTRVGKAFFFQCIWMSLIRVSGVRNAALAYLLKRMPKVYSNEGMPFTLSLNI